MAELEKNELLNSAIAEGFAFEQQAAIPPGASERLADYSQTLINDFPDVLVAASSAFAAKVAKIVVAVVAALGIGVGVYVYSYSSAPEPEHVVTPAQNEPAVIEPSEDTHYSFAPKTSVSFSGSSSLEHVNPLEASAATSEGTITQWVISDTSGAIVLQGEGASTGRVLGSLAKGSYTVYFSVVDDKGTTALVQRDFVVQ